MSAQTAPALPEIRPINIIERVTTELRKALDFRAGKVLIFVTLGLQLLLTVMNLIFGDVEPTITDAFLTAGVPLMWVAPILGVILGMDEWRLKSVMITYAQDSNRTAVFIAKAIAGIIMSLGLFAAGALLLSVISVVFGAPLDSVDGLVQQLPAVITGIVLLLLLGLGWGASTLSLALGLVVVLALGQIIPQILGSIPATAEFAPYVDYTRPVNTMVGNGSWPPEWTPVIVALVLWILIPLVVGGWRNATKDIS